MRRESGQVQWEQKGWACGRRGNDGNSATVGTKLKQRNGGEVRETKTTWVFQLEIETRLFKTELVMNRKVARSFGQGNRVGDDHLNIDSHLNSSFHHVTASLQVIAFCKYKFLDLHWKPSADLQIKYKAVLYTDANILWIHIEILKNAKSDIKKNPLPLPFFFFKTNELSVLRQF